MFSHNIQLPPNSEIMKELRKWEQHPTRYAMTEDGDMRPGNPYVFRPYPKMLYKASKDTNGKAYVLKASPEPWMSMSTADYERECQATEAFNKRNTRIVESEAAERLAVGQGWRATQGDALELFEYEEQQIGNASAELEYGAARMSAPAQREVAAAHESTEHHVTDIQPRRRGRPRIKAGAGEVEE